MKPNQQKLLGEIIKGKNPVCLHIYGQSLVDELCEIIKEQWKQQVELASATEYLLKKQNDKT